MSGYVAAQRARFAHHLFAREKFCRGYAWDWMVAQARWEPGPVSIGGRTIVLERGQFTASVRFMADAWNWSKSAVDRFVTRLKSEAMIGTASEQGQLVITICNYEKFQPAGREAGTDAGTPTGTAAGQQRDKLKKGKEGKEEEEGARKRASRLPEGWKLSEADRAYAVSQGLPSAHVERTAEKFRNYWLAKSGRDATKTDWHRTWCNWVLREAETLPKIASPPDLGAKLKRWERIANRYEETGT